ncbi:MAG: glycosyltransferase family 61 protein [Paracoccaceae bacterium]
MTRWQGKSGPLAVEVVENACAIPFGGGKERALTRTAGVFDAAGRPVDRAVCWRNSSTPVTRPGQSAAGEPAESLPGRWLFGGMLYGHFGHFLCESTARLWALGQTEEPLDGVFFFPKRRVGRPARLVRDLMPWLRAAGVDLPVHVSNDPVHVERLHVPDQGFGTGDMIGGTPEYRRYVAESFGAGIPADGAEKVYISRSRLYSKRGRILGEDRIEAGFAGDGYRIFHPQEHDLAAQIAQYKAARVVVSPDCSALHLAAFFARPGDRVAIILRRPGDTVADFIEQYDAFCGLKPHVADCVLRVHSFEGARLGQMSEVYAELDFAALTVSLCEAGFLSTPATVAAPDPGAIAAEIAALSERLGAPIVPVA